MEGLAAAATFPLAIVIVGVLLATMIWWSIHRARAPLATLAAKSAIAGTGFNQEVGEPHLSWGVAGLAITDNLLIDPGSARVANTGRGPLVHGLCCLIWERGETRYLATTDLFDLDPDEEGDVTLHRRSAWIPDEEITGASAYEAPVRVAFCQDRMGTYYRFVSLGQDLTTWRDALGSRPRWVDFYLEHLTVLRRH